jgi:flagellar assembly protein FliH
MTSSPEVSSGSRSRTPRETLLLRGASAADAVPYQRSADGPPTWGRRSGRRSEQPAGVAAPVPPPAPAPPAPRTPVVHDLGTSRGGTDVAGPAGVRLGDVYADQLERLREEARSEGWAAGHAEGLVAAGQVVAAAERAAEQRLADVQARWERRLASATAAMGAAVERLDATAAPDLDELRDSVLDAVVLLVGDLLGREVATADANGLDALRRALTLCPTDVPVVVRLHPDDLAEVPAAALAQLPASVTVVADEAVERAGALAEAGSVRVDAQLTSALQRVLEVLHS